MQYRHSVEPPPPLTDSLMWINIPRTPGESATSEPEGAAEAIGSKSDIDAGECEAGRGPLVQRTWPERALSARRRHADHRPAIANLMEINASPYRLPYGRLDSGSI